MAACCIWVKLSVMDAVELPYPVDVAAAPKLMGSEGFVRAGVSVKELEACESDSVSVIVSPSVQRCSTGDLCKAFVFALCLAINI